MSKLQVAVLRGGPSSEYDISLKTGGTILKAMPEKFQAHDIFISKEGIWHREGAERRPERALSDINVVINALHGQYGEDGKVQQILDRLSIPYTGSDSIVSALGMNKNRAKNIFEKLGIKTPYFALIKNTDDMNEKAKYVFNNFMLPFIVKPVSSGSSRGVSVVKDFRNLRDALESAFTHSDTAIIEEYIKGREASVGVIDNFRNEKTYTLLPVEINHGSDYYNLEAKYSDSLIQKVPGNFTLVEKSELQRLARLVHEGVGARHYSRSDFIVNPRRGIYLLEINTQPPITPESTFSKALDAVGCALPDFLEHITGLALGGL